jgi:hypothetical protein
VDDIIQSSSFLDVHPAFSDYTTIAAQELVASQASARPERSLYRESDAREMLGKYMGGTITLHRDESTGIARLTIANAGKKNAFSGMIICGNILLSINNV